MYITHLMSMYYMGNKYFHILNSLVLIYCQWVLGCCVEEDSEWDKGSNTGLSTRGKNVSTFAKELPLLSTDAPGPVLRAFIVPSQENLRVQ